MAEIYFPDYPEKLNPVANDLLLIADSQDQDVDGKKKFKRTKAGNIESLSVPLLTYAALETLVTASELVTGAKYLITDATTANIQLIVEAIAINKIHTDAKSPDFPQDVIQYDFTNDIITWRWDTLLDISVAQDLRNLQNLTIGTGGSNIHCGSGTTGIIGNNATNLTITACACEIRTGTGWTNVELRNMTNDFGICNLSPYNDFLNVLVDGQIDTNGIVQNITGSGNVTIKRDTSDDSTWSIYFENGVYGFSNVSI